MMISVRRIVSVVIAVVCCVAGVRTAAAQERTAAGPPYQATGFKVGEVTSSSAIVWTRLTLRPERNPGDPTGLAASEKAEKKASKKDGNKKDGAQDAKRDGKKDKQKDGKNDGQRGSKKDGDKDSTSESAVAPVDLPGAVPGAEGEVRVGYRPPAATAWQYTGWWAVDPHRDFTRQFAIKDLTPDTQYQIRVEACHSGGGPAGATLDGQFRTAPPPDKPSRVVFVVTTCHALRSRDCPEGFKIYGHMLKLAPSFFVHTGDIVYYDGEPDTWARSVDLARYHWWRTYSLPSDVAFHRRVSSYFEKDDHDTWQNDCWPTMKSNKMGKFTFAQGQAIFREQVPMGESTYRTFRWGKDLQIWLVEGRDFRSPNNDPDGPEKTIWGQKQKAWFKETVQASDAAFRLLISPTPLVGPDRTNKNDNYSNKGFTYEGDELRRFIGGQKNMAVIHGDRHWQYHSIDPKTGVREYSVGPCSDKHAGGWSQKDFIPEYHRYLNIKGGFLAGIVERVEGKPRLTLQFYDVDGKVRFEDKMEGSR